MEGSKIFAENKLMITVGDVSFSEQDIVAQSNVKKIGLVMDMLVVEIDQQMYEDYLSSGSGNLIETRRYRRVLSKIRKSGNKEFSVNRESFDFAAIEPSLE